MPAINHSGWAKTIVGAASAAKVGRSFFAAEAAPTLVLFSIL